MVLVIGITNAVIAIGEEEATVAADLAVTVAVVVTVRTEGGKETVIGIEKAEEVAAAAELQAGDLLGIVEAAAEV